MRGTSYTQLPHPSVKLWKRGLVVGISFIYFVIILQKIKQIGVWELNNRGEWCKMVRICQSEHTNHTHVTALERTVFVHGLPLKLDASS